MPTETFLFSTNNFGSNTLDIFEQISIFSYIIGLFLWFIFWKYIIGYNYLKKIPTLHIPFWGFSFVMIINIILTYLSTTPAYDIEIGIYSYVERNSITVATLALGIAVFVVLTFKDQLNMLKHAHSTKFLQLVFISFLIVVLGSLPLYWIPQIDGWLTVLRNLKTIPFLYSLFTLASAIVIYLHILKDELNKEG